VPLEPPVPLEPDPWSVIVPVTLGLVGCGVKVSVVPATQYEY
jgi:hypothetical protein